MIGEESCWVVLCVQKSSREDAVSTGESEGDEQKDDGGSDERTTTQAQPCDVGRSDI